MRALAFVTVLSLGLCSAACAGSSQGDRAPIGRTLDSERQAAEARADQAGPEDASQVPDVPDDVVARAAADLSGLRNVDRSALSFETMMTYLASADAICIGERHDDAGDHFAELRAVQALLERRRVRGFELGIGLEMVTAGYQPALTSYIDGGVSDETLQESLAWGAEWGFDFSYYQPILHESLVRFGSLVALGVHRDVTRDVAAKGLDGLNPNQRRALPELDLDVPGHRAVFDSMMTLHPGLAGPGPAPHAGSPNAVAAAQAQKDTLNRYYEAQVVWDESMADRAASWLTQRYPGRKLVILAGAAHCHPSAIPARIRRRAAFTVVSVLPRAKDEPTDPGRDRLVREYEYLLLRDSSPAAP